MTARSWGDAKFPSSAARVVLLTWLRSSAGSVTAAAAAAAAASLERLGAAPRGNAAMHGRHAISRASRNL